jgi:hypothetical protein
VATFRVARASSLSAVEAWLRVTDWRRHGAHVPLTRVTARPPEPTRRGTVVVARTGVGGFGFDDPMEVVRWNPPTQDLPGACRLEKRGTVVDGWAEIEVRPWGQGSLVVWREHVQVATLPRVLDAPVAWAGAARSASTCAFWRRPTRTWPTWCAPSGSAKTSITG